MSELEARIAALLSDHEASPTTLQESGYLHRCSCKHSEFRGRDTGLPPMLRGEWERAHQATVLATLVRGVVSDALLDATILGSLRKRAAAETQEER